MPTVLITGCSSGFGELAALTFARHGWRVWATMRTPDNGDRLRKEAAAAGLDLHVTRLDVTDQESIDRAIDAAGPIDALVNNAGVEQYGSVHLVSDAEARWQFDTNVFGLLNVIRATVPAMLARGSGVVVNVGSVAGYVGVPYSGLYAASKHAVSALSEALHFEVGHRGVRVVVVEPGQFATDLGAKSRTAAAMTEGGEDDRRRARFREAIGALVPGGEPADPQVVADAILRAATDPATPLHLPVGGDAELITQVKRSMTFEDFEQTMRTTLNWFD